MGLSFSFSHLSGEVVPALCVARPLRALLGRFGRRTNFYVAIEALLILHLNDATGTMVDIAGNYLPFSK
jgi:hypothetical protein